MAIPGGVAQAGRRRPSPAPAPPARSSSGAPPFEKPPPPTAVSGLGVVGRVGVQSVSARGRVHPGVDGSGPPARPGPLALHGNRSRSVFYCETGRVDACRFKSDPELTSSRDRAPLLYQPPGRRLWLATTLTKTHFAYWHTGRRKHDRHCNLQAATPPPHAAHLSSRLRLRGAPGRAVARSRRSPRARAACTLCRVCAPQASHKLSSG